MSWSKQFDLILRAWHEKAVAFYGTRLISIVVFGSVGRGAMRPDSDIDVLFVIDPLPKARRRRVEEFHDLECQMDEVLKETRLLGVPTALSPLFKTPEEVCSRSPLFLDLVDDARILFDRDRAAEVA
jgi:predicted nucleotidyltransferase